MSAATARTMVAAAGEGLANLASRPLLALVSGIAVGLVVVAAVLPGARNDAAATKRAVDFTRTGGLTFEVAPGITSIRRSTSPADCDRGWRSSATVVAWAGGLGAPWQERPRGPISLPVTAYTASTGMVRQLVDDVDVDVDDPLLVSRAYADEAGLRPGSLVSLEGSPRRTVVFDPPPGFAALERSLVVPARTDPVVSCYVQLHPSVWDSAEPAITMTRPPGITDWAVQCLSCDRADVGDAIDTAEGGRGAFAIGPPLAACLAAVHLFLRRSELALYRAVVLDAGGLMALVLTELLGIALIGAVVGFAAATVLAGDDLQFLGDFSLLYLAQATVVLATLVAAGTLFTLCFNGRRILLALRD